MIYLPVPNMFWSLLVAGLCYLIDGDQEESTARLAAVATFIYIFAAFYSPGKCPFPI